MITGLRALPVASLVLVVAASIVVISRQGQRIQTLEDIIAESHLKGPLLSGTILPDLTVTDLAGREQLLAYGRSNSKPRIIYVFRPSCVWCQRNGRSVNSLVHQLGSKYDIVGLSLDDDGLAQFVMSHDVKFPTYTVASTPAAEAYMLGRTPETIVVSADGRVLKDWVGGYQSDLQRLIEKFFSLRL